MSYVSTCPVPDSSQCQDYNPANPPACVLYEDQPFLLATVYQSNWYFVGLYQAGGWEAGNTLQLTVGPENACKFALTSSLTSEDASDQPIDSSSVSNPYYIYEPSTGVAGSFGLFYALTTSGSCGTGNNTTLSLTTSYSDPPPSVFFCNSTVSEDYPAPYICPGRPFFFGGAGTPPQLLSVIVPGANACQQDPVQGPLYIIPYSGIQTCDPTYGCVSNSRILDPNLWVSDLCCRTVTYDKACASNLNAVGDASCRTTCVAQPPSVVPNPPPPPPKVVTLTNELVIAGASVALCIFLIVLFFILGLSRR